MGIMSSRTILLNGVISTVLVVLHLLRQHKYFDIYKKGKFLEIVSHFLGQG